eukprot:SRR837773.8435.p6 GENE.SRR837773.8435~~SRR837773.8435.p6  ORF type:complete len:112 (+),score=9.16 SRR837773.8435:821-1156(+)
MDAEGADSSADPRGATPAAAVEGARGTSSGGGTTLNFGVDKRRGSRGAGAARKAVCEAERDARPGEREALVAADRRLPVAPDARWCTAGSSGHQGNKMGLADEPRNWPDTS